MKTLMTIDHYFRHFLGVLKKKIQKAQMLHLLKVVATPDDVLLSTLGFNLDNESLRRRRIFSNLSKGNELMQAVIAIRNKVSYFTEE